MTEITAALVRTLRERTGAGVIDCKKALVETRGDLEAAVDWLRAAEIAKAAGKVDRVAAEGLVGLVVEGPAGAVVELNTTVACWRLRRPAKTAVSPMRSRG